MKKKCVRGILTLGLAMCLMGCSSGADELAELENLEQLEEIAQESVEENATASGTGGSDVPAEYTNLFMGSDFAEGKVWVSNKAEYAELIEELKKSCEKNLDGSMIFATDDEMIFAGGWNATESDGSTVVSPFTTYEIGEMTQSMTAAAILQLVQEEKLKLEDTIGTYFPDYPYGDKVKIENLMYMSSGIPDVMTDPKSFFASAANEGKDPEQLGESFKSGEMSEEEFLEYFNNTKVLFEPESGMGLSGTNYILLARILEQVTGQSYEEYMKENIFDVCKMRNSTCIETGNLTSIPIPGGEEAYRKNGKLCRGVADVHSSPCDMLLFDRALMAGEVIDYNHLSYVTAPKNMMSCGWIMMGPNCLLQTGASDGYISLNYIYTVKDKHYYFILMCPSVERMAFAQQIDLCISKFIEGLEEQ